MDSLRFSGVRRNGVLKNFLKSMLACASLLAISNSSLGSASRWIEVGRTDADCPFVAFFDVLEGYPFGRLRIEIPGRIETIPLAVAQEEFCQTVLFQRTPNHLQIPAYQVSGADLCLGRWPSYSVIRSSGSDHLSCTLSNGLE